jgi:hypothetical protein
MFDSQCDLAALVYEQHQDPDLILRDFAIELGAVAELVGIEVGVVSGVINLESSGVGASDWRLRHEQAYHEARFVAACDRAGG